MTDFDELLEGLDRAELVALRDAIDRRLAELEPALGGIGQEERASMPPKSSPAGAEGRGWVELKTINNCGPYAYLRWHEGGRKRSKYLGKVKG